MNTRSLWLTLSLAAALGMAGCASQPKENARVAQLANELETLKQDTAVQAHAPGALLDAQEAVERAERAHEDGDRSARDHQIYLAERLLETARVIGQRGQNEAEVSRLAEERDRLALAASRSKVEEAEARARELEAELAALEARRTNRGLMLRLDDVFFKTASASIAPGATSTLDKVTEVLAENPEQRVLIEGHTDAVGTASYNQRLSEQRAEAVKGLLVARGIDAERISTYGYGESRPIASNENEGGRQLNRRVEIVFPDTVQ